MVNIQITSGNIADGTLTLSDLGTSGARHNEEVMWILLPNSGVDEIIAIALKKAPSGSTSINIFSDGPKKVGGSSNWKGRVSPISPSVPIGSEYHYSITWKSSTPDLGLFTFDPILRVNP